MAIVKLQSNEENPEVFEVERAIAEMSNTVKNMIADAPEGAYEETAIPLRNVTGPILAKVLEYCKHHHANPPPKEQENKERRTDDITEWDMEFCNVDQKTLFDLILAANFLEIQSLLDLACKTVANQVKDKSPEEICRLFGCEYDFTPEEEEKVKRDNPWLMEK